MDSFLTWPTSVVTVMFYWNKYKTNNKTKKLKMIRLSYRKNLVSFMTNVIQSRSLTNKMCVFTKPHRVYYLRLYPTLVVKPDGSTYTVRHEEPRAIIKLPLDLSTLSEEEKAKVLERRRPKKRVVLQVEETDDYDHTEYLKKLGRKQ